MFRSVQLCRRLAPLQAANSRPVPAGVRLAVSQARPSGSASSRPGSEEGEGPSEGARRRARNFQIATMSACAFFGASYLLYRQSTLRAESEVCGYCST